MWYAIDFGTSNSLVSFIQDGEEPKLIKLEEEKNILRSLIFSPQRGKYYFGGQAIEQYQEQGGEGRFFRSLKKFLPEPSFKDTEVFGKRMKIEELIAVFLRELKKRADEQTGHDVTNVVLGRPALYSLNLDNDQLAEDRMRRAAELAGFNRVEFCPEPVAAGLNVKASNEKRNILVCDFGGGTSDFTLLKVGEQEFSKEDVLGLSGVFIAGDAIDGRIMRNFVSTNFGKDIKYKLPVGNNTLTFPRRLLTKLSNPAHIVFLKDRDTWEFLKEIEQWTVEGDDQRYISQLFCLVEEDLGYPVYAAIEKSKIELGESEVSHFDFSHPGIKIKMPLLRKEFNEAVSTEMSDIFNSLNKVFDQSGLSIEDVDQVQITGGTGQMPLIQSSLIKLFGEDKIEKSEVFQSVVQGLAKYTQQL